MHVRNEASARLSYISLFSGRAGVLLLLLLATLAGSPARAHGDGTPQLVNAAAGPYWMSVWTSPEPARVGPVHFTVSVAEPGEGRQAGPPVLGAAVRLTLSGPRQEDALKAVASNEQSANRLLYETDVVVPREGRWAVMIDVAGPDGSGQVRFDLRVESSQGINWFLIGGVGLVAVAALFLVRSIRGPSPERRSPERRSPEKAATDEENRGVR